MDTVSAEPGPRLPVAAYCVHTSLPVLVPGVPQPVVPYGEVLRFPESGEAPLTGRSCVRHNGDGEKNGDANQVERDVSEVTDWQSWS